MKEIPHQQGLACELTNLIDWPTVLNQPRYAGGHEEVMKNIFGKGSEVIAWWSEESYSGTVAVAHKLQDGRIVVMTDYYGSCSGCDSWSYAETEEAIKMINDLVNHAQVFNSIEDAKEWCDDIDSISKPYEYPFEAAQNLWGVTENNIVGKKVSDLPRKIHLAIEKNDGNSQMTTAEFVPGRFRVEVEKGIITKFNGMG